MTAAFAPPFPTNPNPGDTFCGWTWTGSIWVCTAGQGVITQVFPASAPYTPSPGLMGLIVEVLGAGGCGGSLTVPYAGAWCAGSGGGSGGYSRKALSPALVRGGVLVTIAPGSTTPSPIGPPTFAGDTAFGSLCVAHGGGNAWPYLAASGYYSAHGYAAYEGIGDLVLPGVPGSAWSTVNIATSANGATMTTYALDGMGGAILSGQSGMTFELGSADGQAAQGPNAGGSGAVSNDEAVATTRPGGVGGSGLVIVTEFIFADQGGNWGPPSGCGPGARVAIGSGGPQGWGYEND